MAWVIEALTIGWPPSVQLKRRAGHEEALDDLFIFLSDKRLLLYGYGRRSGINDLDDLRSRVGLIREPLLLAVKAVGSKAPIAEWLERLRSACHELVDHATEAINTTDETARSSGAVRGRAGRGSAPPGLPFGGGPRVGGVRASFCKESRRGDRRGRCLATHPGPIKRPRNASYPATRIGGSTSRSSVHAWELGLFARRPLCMESGTLEESNHARRARIRDTV